MNPGKRFEDKFRRSLELRDGLPMRLQDKCFLGRDGRLLSEPSEGDFLFFGRDGHAYLIECKATGVARFPFDKLKEKQERSLLDFDAVADNCHGLVALNFYGSDIRKDNRCFLVGIRDYLEYKRACGRKSMPLSAAEEVCTECPRIKGAVWELPV